MGDSFEFYKKISEDNKARLDTYQKKIEDLLEENYALKSDLYTLKLQVSFLMKYNCMKANCKSRITNSDDIDNINENALKQTVQD